MGHSDAIMEYDVRAIHPNIGAVGRDFGEVIFIVPEAPSEVNTVVALPFHSADLVSFPLCHLDNGVDTEPSVDPFASLG
jgi:hypothetical protein